MSEEGDPDLDDLRPILAGLLPTDWDRPIDSHDQAALDAALRSAWRVVYFRVVARTGDMREAEEVAQEVFCRVLARMGSRPSDDALRHAYLARAARNLLQDQWRQRHRRQVADTAYAGDRSGAPIDPEDATLRRLEAESLMAAVRALPPVQAQVLRLRIAEELTSEETAAVLGKTAAAVRQIQHRALRALRDRLSRPDAEGGS